MRLDQILEENEPLRDERVKQHKEQYRATPEPTPKPANDNAKLSGEIVVKQINAGWKSTSVIVAMAVAKEYGWLVGADVLAVDRAEQLLRR